MHTSQLSSSTMGCVKKLAIVIPVLAVGLYFLRKYIVHHRMCMSDAKLMGKVVIITGANTGIGKMNALDHVRRGARVIMACRSMERGEAAAADILDITGAPKSQIEVMKLDLSSLTSIRMFVQEFRKMETQLDILINNAGVIMTSYSKTEDGFETTMGVNHLGHFYLTNLLLDMLKRSAPSRIINVSSSVYDSADLNLEVLMMERSYSGLLAYRNSKLANIMFTRELARRLEGTGVTTYSLHPGAIATYIYQQYATVQWFPLLYEVNVYIFGKDIEEGAQTQICCAVDPELANETGKYYRDCREEALEPIATDDDKAAKLWKISAELVGLKDSKMA